jgi:2-dehydro-3-deoxy-D-arabinonate dehydratase
MKICRFENPLRQTCIGLVLSTGEVLDLSPVATHLGNLLEQDDLLERLTSWQTRDFRRYRLAEVRVLAPIDRQEVWAAGVTYVRSKQARMEESEFSATAYDKVYSAPRPELFFKSLPQKVAGPGEAVGIRADAKWNVPEPELALVINSRRRLIGFTAGNDMSSRDIEGENLLYLPQAKIYERSCALGPFITLGVSESEARAWSIQLLIQRAGQAVFQGETSVGQIKRSFGELIDYLFRSQSFPEGVVLLTGTGVVPPDTFTLLRDDRIAISISGVGTLENTVILV